MQIYRNNNIIVRTIEEKNKLYKQQLKKESESFQKFLKSLFYKDFFDIS